MTEEQKEELVRQYYGDGYRSRNQLTKIVDRKLELFGGISPDHTDFYSLANETFVKCLNSFDETREVKFDTYFSNCLSKKIKTQISYTNRDKRRNKDKDGNIIPDDSLDRIISADNPDTTVGSTVMDDRQNIEHSATEREGNVNEYINSLSTPMQKKIAECWLEGMSHIETRKTLGLEEGEYNRIFAQMKAFNSLRVLRRGDVMPVKHIRNEKSITNKKEGKDMYVAKISDNADKSKLEGLTTAALIKEIDTYNILTDHPLQREPDQWTTEYQGNLITTILNNYKFNPLVVCQEYKGDMPYNWLIDGKQRATTIWKYRKDSFKISKKSLHTVMKYRAVQKDEKGNILKDEAGRPLYETKTFDVADKKFSDLPKELQEIFDYYMVSIERYLNCTEEEVQYHIIRYNDAKPMSASSKGTLKLGEDFAKAVKQIVAKSPLFTTYKEMTGFSTSKPDVLYRIVTESIMSSFYLDDWNKGYEKNCAFLSKNGTASDFDEFAMLTDSMTQVIDEETGKLLNPKNSLVWIAVFNMFLSMMEDNEGLTYGDFNGFMKEFLKGSFGDRKVNENSFNDLEERGSKDKSVVAGKIDILVTLLKEFLGGGDGGSKQSVETVNEEETDVQNAIQTSESTSISSSDTANEEVVVEEENVEKEASSESDEVVWTGEEEIDNESAKAIEEVVETFHTPSKETIEDVVEEPATEPVEVVEEQDEPDDECTDIYEYIGRFRDQEVVKKLKANSEIEDKDINRTALLTAMMFDNKEDLSDENIHQYLEEKDFADEKLNEDIGVAFEKVNEWAALTVGNNRFVTIQNLPVIICLGKYATDKGYDSKKVKNWFETFAFTFANKGYEGRELYELLKIGITEMKKNCEAPKRPMLNF